ncbi:MAG: class I SAM-dependent rRNA methyltransferase, partial [Alphaproteobacteria bacterium]|nr:class I SAM-dependent rRNA methyltransferase [Alphaproteobacteria bacterium]
MPDRPVIPLRPKGEAKLRAGHPWLYADDALLEGPARRLPAGELVTVAGAQGRPLAAALFNLRSQIVLRVLDRDPTATVDAAWFAKRLAAARALRDRALGGTHYRLVHAEADGLPGLIIDRYGEVAVVQINTAGLDRLLEPLLAGLDAAIAPHRVVLRNDSPLRALEGLGEEVKAVKGEIDGPIEVVENGLRFLADPLGGQKTGWFFDQRRNRADAARLAAGARVLDVYTHTGGFALTAAAAGAAEVIAIDRSAFALDLAVKAAALNRLAESCSFQEAEAFPALEKLARQGERFGLVVVDPPAFVKNKTNLAAGLHGYRKLARLAGPCVADGGFLVFCSCSQPVGVEDLIETLQVGLAEVGRTLRVIRIAGADMDHPQHPLLPQSTYLKA